MNEFAKTGAIAGGAVLLALLATLTGPRAVTHEMFSDEGQAFFPTLTDGDAVVDLEVTEFRESSSDVHKFKVTRDDKGRFIVSAGARSLSAAQVFLNTGTHAFMPSAQGLDKLLALDNAGILALTERPAHLIVVGGSYIGLELGQIFRRLGSHVTLLERSGAGLTFRNSSGPGEGAIVEVVWPRALFLVVPPSEPALGKV